MVYKYTVIKTDHRSLLKAEDVSGMLISEDLGGVEIISEETFECYSSTLLQLEDYLPPGWGLIHTQFMDSQNWVHRCDQLFDTVYVGELTVQPIASAENVPLTNPQNTIFIIPGLGFGTGHHETTKTALELLQHPYVTKRPPKTALDVGTGSGILAIGIATLFSTMVTGIDIDPDAIENAKENVDINLVTDCVTLVTGTIHSCSDSSDIVIANIYAEVLIELKCELRRCVSPSGLMILSGIMETKRELIYDNFRASEWRFVEERSNSGWISILMERI